jgi:hypothetical protein
MANLEKTIPCLKDLINDPNCRYMNLSNVKGYLGELLVLSRLEGEGKVELKPVRKNNKRRSI